MSPLLDPGLFFLIGPRFASSLLQSDLEHLFATCRAAVLHPARLPRHPLRRNVPFFFEGVERACRPIGPELFWLPCSQPARCASQRPRLPRRASPPVRFDDRDALQSSEGRSTFFPFVIRHHPCTYGIATGQLFIGEGSCLSVRFMFRRLILPSDRSRPGVVRRLTSSHRLIEPPSDVLAPFVVPLTVAFIFQGTSSSVVRPVCAAR